jgi:uncharacterized protein
VPQVAFRLGVHPYQWSNGLIALRNLGSGVGSLVSFGAFLPAGWYGSSVLLRTVSSVEAEQLWGSVPRPGLEYADVRVPGPLGDYPAWLVEGDGERDTWVLAVHGRGADRREALRVLPALHRCAVSVLMLTYRNDAGAPASPDGYYHLGDTEWTDLLAAVRYAQEHGARRIVLYGWSMGAAIIGAYLGRLGSDAGVPVAGVIWDSPVLDWRATLRQQARVHRLPTALAGVTAWCASARIGIDFGRFDLVRRPPRSRPPTLLIHGAADDAVPVGPSRALAAVARRLAWPLRLVEIAGAGHTAGWNTDPAGYEGAVTRFLDELLHGGPG